MDINIIGVKTLYIKEVRRFLKVYHQTILAPVVTSMLFLAIFTLAIGDRVDTVNNTSFKTFMAAGLIIMTIIQQAFANSSSSFVMGKVLGNIIDILMPPIKPSEIILCYCAGAMTRGFMVGIISFIAMSFFVPLSIHDLAIMFIYVLLATMLMGLLGILAGILSDSFDQMAAFTNYVITPLAFLSGTFYSIKDLPQFWYKVSKFNPFFYIIDGFRYSVTGFSDGNINLGMYYLIFLNVSLWLLNSTLIKKGYRLKS